MKNTSILLTIIICLTVNGCSETPDHSHNHDTSQPHHSHDGDLSKDHSHESMEEILLCGKCGQVKGTEICCKKDAVKCGCGAVKGSPACCKVEITGTDIHLCDHCGQVKVSDSCCKSDVEKCPKCKMAKGSPGCCIKRSHSHF